MTPKAKCMVCEATRIVGKVDLFNFNKMTLSVGAFDGVAKLRRQNWLRILKKTEDDICKYKSGPFICSKHFKGDKPSKIHQAHHPDWLPSQKLEKRKLPNKPNDLKNVSSKDLPKRFFLDSMNTELKSLSHTIASENASSIIDLGLVRTHHQSNIQCPQKCRSQKLKTVVKSTQTRALQIYQNVPPTGLPCVSVYPQLNQTLAASTSLPNPKDLYIKKLMNDMNVNAQVIQNLKVKLSHYELNEDSFIGNDKKTQYYTGFSTYMSLINFKNSVVDVLPDFTSKGISKFGTVLLVLMKLRFDFPFEYLCSRFNISYFDVYEVFSKGLIKISNKNKRLTVPRSIPGVLESVFGGRVTAVVDIIEIDIDMGAGPWESIKFLIAYAPSGHISFVSKPFPGKSTDKWIVEKSKWLNKLGTWDLILSLRSSLAEDIVKRGSTRDKVFLYESGRSSLIQLENNLNMEVRSTLLEYMDGWSSVFKYLTHKQPEFYVKEPTDFLYKCVTLCAFLNNLFYYN